jgi:predicted nucleic acid-binding protein
MVDTSAWIEFLRDTDSAVCKRVEELLASDIAICDPIRMEVLAGARDAEHLSDLRRLLARASVLPTTPVNYEQAAALYRTCRRNGETVRRMIDCLIAAVALHAGASILHADGDFDVLARHTALPIESV